MSALPYSTGAERSTSLARAMAALITGLAGLWLVVVSWSAARWGLVALGLIGCLACLGWSIAARRGRRRADEAVDWRLVADAQGVRFTGTDLAARSWDEIAAILVDEETLEVVLNATNAAGGTSPLRIAPCWGNLGAYELARWLERQRPGHTASGARPDKSD